MRKLKLASYSRSCFTKFFYDCKFGKILGVFFVAMSKNPSWFFLSSETGYCFI